MVDTQRALLSPKFEQDHPAIEALENEIENLKASYEVLGDTLAAREDELEKTEESYQQIQSRVRVARENLYSNERQQAALRDAIEYLTGKRP